MLRGYQARDQRWLARCKQGGRLDWLLTLATCLQHVSGKARFNNLMVQEHIGRLTASMSGA